MNREIKFRAWSKKKNTMYYSIAVSPSDKRFLEWSIGGEGITIRADSKEFEITQYTGINDKNGIEIYEGDIVKAFDIYGDYTGVIEWWRDRWTLTYEGIDGETKQYQSLMTVRNSEIIGNIYENPELLK